MVANDAKSISIRKQLDVADRNWKVRSEEIAQGISSVDSRLNEATLIFDDLKENFAGRLEEAAPALRCTSRKFDAN